MSLESVVEELQSRAVAVFADTQRSIGLDAKEAKTFRSRELRPMELRYPLTEEELEWAREVEARLGDSDTMPPPAKHGRAKKSK